MKQLYIQGIFNEMAGRRDQAVADLNVFLDSPAGVGEHGGIASEIKSKIEELEKYDSMIGVMQKYFAPPAEDGATPDVTLPGADGKPPARVLDEDETE